MVHRQKNSHERKSSGESSFKEWMTGNFDTWQDRVKRS